MQELHLLQMAYIVGQQSKCVSWKVGAIIAKDGRIISTGYNGTPSGQCNCREHAMNQNWLKSGGTFRYLDPAHRKDHSEWSMKNEIHAELNAILFAARHGTSIDGAEMYVTVSPCAQCAKAIANSGIKKLYYCEEYDMNHVDWQSILEDAGVETRRIDKKRMQLINHDRVFSQQSKENLENEYESIVSADSRKLGK